MIVIATDPSRRDLGPLSGCALDMAIGGGKDSFEATVPVELAPKDVGAGSLLYVDGTEFGGVVDDVGADTTERHSRAVYRGRTWSGVLESRVLEPNPGTTHLAVEGEANAAVKALVDRMGLADLFDVSLEDSGFSCESRLRYATGCSGLRSALADAKRSDGEPAPLGAKLAMRWTGRKVVLSAVAAVDHSGHEHEAARTRMRIVKAGRPVNHLVCLGGGEMEGRFVAHVFADAERNVSRTQTLFGLDERAALYDYGSVESDAELVERGIERLREMQDVDVCDVSGVPGGDYGIGDAIGGRESRLGIYVSAVVNAKAVSITGRGATATYRAGSARPVTRAV